MAHSLLLRLFMNRKPRKRTAIYPGEDAHTIARINNGEFLLKGIVVTMLLKTIMSIFRRYEAAVYAVVVMTNHLHVLHAHPEKNPDTKLGRRLTSQGKLITVGDLKRHFLSVFARSANTQITSDARGRIIERVTKAGQKIRRRFGCLIKDRSKSIAITTENQALTNLIYLMLNPVRAGMVDHPAKYPHSNYEMYATGIAVPGYTFHPEYLALAPTLKECARLFRELIDQAVEATLAQYRLLKEIAKKNPFQNNEADNFRYFKVIDDFASLIERLWFRMKKSKAPPREN